MWEPYSRRLRAADIVGAFSAHPNEIGIDMVGCVAIFMFGCAVFLLWGVISPRSQWETLSAWQYKNREANEPSEAAFMGTRIASAFSIIVLVGVGVFILSSQDDWEAENQRKNYEECLDDRENDEGLLSPEEWCENMSPSPTQ